jgi:hypothetical protein
MQSQHDGEVPEEWSYDGFVFLEGSFRSDRSSTFQKQNV